MTKARCPECGAVHEEEPYPWPRPLEWDRMVLVELCEQCVRPFWYQAGETGAPSHPSMALEIDRAEAEGEAGVATRLKDREGRPSEIKREARNNGTRRRTKAPTPNQRRETERKKKAFQRLQAKRMALGITLLGHTSAREITEACKYTAKNPHPNSVLVAALDAGDGIDYFEWLNDGR